MSDLPTLVVSEVFGPTVQGEGPTIGRRAAFVRLGRCNLDCSWCDTPYTWDWDRYDPKVELHERPVAEVVAEVEAMGVDWVVVTGGEPLLQQRRLLPFLLAASDRGWTVEVETTEFRMERDGTPMMDSRGGGSGEVKHHIVQIDDFLDH